MANRTERAAIAAETLAILAAGEYVTPSGRTVDLRDAIDAAVHGTRCYTPSKAERRVNEVRAAPPVTPTTVIDVRNESTFVAARRLVGEFGPAVAALNFASAKNPGGGFLGGSQAQEESLARASALYACLQTQSGYYAANRVAASALYTDHLIVSPGVPVFRDDADRLLEEPWAVTLLTSPAPNAGAVRRNEPGAIEDLEPTLRRRAGQVLAAAAADGCRALVLGAWGCGVFANDAATVAAVFADWLRPGGPMAGRFERVTFAVLDARGETFAAFAQAFGELDQTG